MPRRFPTPSRTPSTRQSRTQSKMRPQSTNLFEHPAMQDFYHTMMNYATTLLTQCENECDDNSVLDEYWVHCLKYLQKWDRVQLDNEVHRIVRMVAGEYDEEDDLGEDDDTVSELPAELQPYYENFETYIEMGRWLYMSYIAPSNSDPVDDIPKISPTDFLKYYLYYVTRHPSVKKRTFLSYDEVNKNKVIEACLTAALKRSIPPTVINALIAAHAKQSRRGPARSTSRTRPLVRVQDQFGPDMMSSRATAFRSQNSTTAATRKPLPKGGANHSVSEIVEEEEEDGSKEEEQVEETVEEESSVIPSNVSTAPALGKTTEAVQQGERRGDEDEEGVQRIDLESLRTQDFRSTQ